MGFASRTNPWSLLPGELAFDRSQTAARLMSESGGFRQDFEPQADIEEGTVVEPVDVPNWRLAGVIIAESVVALLDTGSVVVEIRPGAAVPETEWVCISIDEEKAVLRHRRDVQPKEVTIRLASQIFGLPGQGGGLGGPGGGDGAPGGAPPGMGGPAAMPGGEER